MALKSINFADKSLWNPGNIALNNVNVATIGELNAMFAAQGLQINYGSQDDLGKRIVIAEKDAADYSLTTVGTLYGGIYQLVHVNASATAANVKQGTTAFFLDGTSNAGAVIYDVTDGAHFVAIGQIAGVFLNAITPGNYGFIQVHGKCTVQYITTVTATTAGSAIIPSGTAGLWDAPTQSGNPTFLQFNQVLGVSISNPANGALGTVQMGILRGRY
jgi:hypothetical protein